MKKMVAFVALASLLVAPTLAQVPDPGPDSYGIYFYTVEGDFVNQINDVPANSVVPTYVILAGITGDTVDGWEVAFAFTAGTGEIISTVYLGDAVNFFDKGINCLNGAFGIFDNNVTRTGHRRQAAPLVRPARSERTCPAELHEPRVVSGYRAGGLWTGSRLARSERNERAGDRKDNR